jgi:predicted NACHT family NTPase
MKADFENIADVSAIGQGKAVPLEDIYVSLKLSQSYSTVEPEIPDEIKAEMKSRGKPGEDEIAQWERARMTRREQVMDADLAVERFRRLVITGAPGAGKTTLLKHLALKACKENLVKKDRLRVPVWITLRELLQCKAQCLRHYIDKVFEKYKFPDAKESVEKDLETGTCTVLLDGFDELATPENQDQVAAHIHEFAKQYPQCRLVVTSRTAG